MSEHPAIRYRLRRSTDIINVDTDADVSPRDTVMVAELNGAIVGFLAMRVVVLVHDLTLASGMLPRKVAEGLLHYASGYARASGQTEAVFSVRTGNGPMRRWLEERGAVKDEPAEVYTLEVL